ncbi:MAG: ABC transporter permease [Bacilli bacterium]
MNKNKIQLAIIKANGFSTSKITLCMSLIPMIVAIIGGGLGYILSILFQQGLFLIISSYIFLSVNFFTFNIGILIGIIILVFLLSSLFVFINLKILFKRPIALTINQTIEVKNNLFINLLNKVQIGFNSNMKLKNQLLFLNIPRTIFYFISSTMCIFLIGAFSSFSDKLNLAQTLTNSNKQYNYSVDFVTPTEQGGLYKTQKYSELGFPNEAIGIYDMYTTIYPDRPTSNLFPYNANDLKVLEKVSHSNGTTT